MLQKIIGMVALCLTLNTSINAQQFANSKQILFNGNFKTIGEKPLFYLGLQNNSNTITGYMAFSEEEIYQVEGVIAASGEVWAKLKKGNTVYNCRLFYRNQKLFVALDEDVIAAIKLFLILVGEWEAALAIQDENEMTSL